jgi:O-antigen ligase
MTDVAQARTLAKMFDRARWARHADLLAVAVAVSLPWSTSVTGILIAIWLLVLLPTLRPAEVGRELMQPAAGLAVLLWLVAVVGVLWSPASLAEQVTALRGIHKLLVIPLLFAQFRRSDKGHWVLGGFLASCTVLLAVSFLLHAFPQLVWRSRPFPAGVPVKDYIVQSAEFLICAFALGHLAIDAWCRREWALTCGLTALALLFLGNMAFVATGRTSVTAFGVLLLLIAVQRFGWRGICGAILAGAVLGAAAFASSSYLRERTLGVVEEIQIYHRTNTETSSGIRLEFWKKSVAFVAEAPLVGHGTGSIPTLFRRVAGADGLAAAVTGNPHNQTLEIAVQLGLLGVSVLYAMWIGQFMLFRGGGLAASLGQALVAQSVVGSLFLSYLLDFSTGWIYVFGVGVLGGMAVGGRGLYSSGPAGPSD